jgi:tetratricopeptide (TPR) repeat protein
MDLANLLTDIGETRHAAACLKRLVQLDPENSSAWQNLGVAHFLRNRFGEGIAACQEALRQDPHNLMASHNLAMALGQLRQYDEALASVRQAMEIDPKHPRLQNLEFRLRIQRWRWKIFSAIGRVLRFGR